LLLSTRCTRARRDSSAPRAAMQRAKGVRAPAPFSPAAFSARMALVARRAALKTCVACQPTPGDASVASASAAAFAASARMAPGNSG
jgi:hypothetical protein